MIVFDYMVADTVNKKKLKSSSNRVFIRGRKINISPVFIKQPYFAVLKNIILNSKHYFVMKIQYKRALQQSPFNNSSDINFHELINRYKKFYSKIIFVFSY